MRVRSFYKNKGILGTLRNRKEDLSLEFLKGVIHKDGPENNSMGVNK
jgi:hypothetical protein